MYVCGHLMAYPKANFGIFVRNYILRYTLWLYRMRIYLFRHKIHVRSADSVHTHIAHIIITILLNYE